MRLAVAVIVLGAAAGPAPGFEFGLPVGCTMGESCFLQQGSDVDPRTDAATDPFCGGATYEGHDGTDIRVRSLAEIGSVEVLAAADGVVAGRRDGVADRLLATEADRAAVAGRECGNGVVLDHGDGWVTQYCHMQLGSVAVSEGQAVRQGDVLGRIGASGDVQFPHLHFSVRRDEVPLDPFTGRDLTAGCGDGTPLWTAAAAAAIHGWEGSVLDIGFAGVPIAHEALVAAGAPPEPTSHADAFVGWVWLANLRAGDTLVIRLETASGTVVAEDTQVIERNKADYSAFVGRRGAPAPGAYRVRAVVVRDGAPAITAEAEMDVQ